MTSRPALLRRTGMARDGRLFLIRPSAGDDAQALVAVRDAVAAEGELIAGAPGGRSALEEGLALAGLLSQGGLSLTLEVEGAVAGHLMVRRLHQRLGDDEGEVAIAVHNSARGVGLGRMLMDTAIDWARVVRIRRLRLGVFPSNERAIRLYRSVGFVEEPGPSRLDLPEGPRELLLMTLSL